ncbi:LacI family DNA-binding transcriptional regulator [Nonomuraea jiangxiensis]|uniref:LacI family transcriptional regulator n=1 Tax=Nonomuraea jiangxiensis TaxID=633440 RepID=A0A1G9MLW7_9ACTN|nr:LacI family DNA-binding transcriptional regulator [Nonomuraea jiangxiensis]SDL74897.1 LacI family transcriptional regulator [Nonomuraea jiangxiensis]
MQKITIRDIARLAGVSKSTVSLVLNNSPRVDPETRRRVLAIIRRHNYVPNATASALAKGRPPFIGMIVPGLTWRMVAPLNYGVASVVERTPYEIILYTSTNDHDYAPVIDRMLASGMSAGVLVINQDQAMQPLLDLHAQGVPVILINTLGSRLDLPSVEADSYEGAYGAVRHLLDLGHRRIASLAGPMTYPCCQDRQRGYEDALTAAGVPIEAPLTLRTGFDPPTARELLRALLDRPDRPTAVFAHNDATAYAAMEAAADLGLRVPADVSVVGFDDIPSSAHVKPALTTVSQPFEEMGAQAARMLLAAISPESAADFAPDGPPPTRVHLPTTLVVRDSTGPAPN